MVNQMTDLKQIRKALGISRTEVCKATGVSYHTWKHWEDGDRRTPGYAWTLLYYYLVSDKNRTAIDFKQSLQRIVAKADSRAD